MSPPSFLNRANFRRANSPHRLRCARHLSQLGWERDAVHRSHERTILPIQAPLFPFPDVGYAPAAKHETRNDTLVDGPFGRWKDNPLATNGRGVARAGTGC